jgi:hypothetical protein
VLPSLFISINTLASVPCTSPLIFQDPTKIHYGCGAATVAQVNKVSSDLAALEPKVAAAARAMELASSVQATLGGSNQTTALRAEVDALRAGVAALTAADTRATQQLTALEAANQTAARQIAVLTAIVQELQANATNATNPGIVSQQLAALAAADVGTAQRLALLVAANTTSAQQIANLAAANSRAAQQLALLEAANQTAALEITALKSAAQQCTCGLELKAVNSTLADIRSVQQADAAAISLAKATVNTLKSTVMAGAAATESVNSSLTFLAAAVANVSAMNFSAYAKISDLANINAVTLAGVPAAQFLRVRVVLYQESAGGRTGDLGGRTGADALCSLASSRPPGLARVHAFLTTSASDEIRNFPSVFGLPTGLPFESPTGAVVAGNFTDLLDGTISQSLFDAGVLTASGVAWWSGTDSGGQMSAATCKGFTSIERTANSGRAGISNSASSNWISNSFSICELTLPIVCVAF